VEEYPTNYALMPGEEEKRDKVTPRQPKCEEPAWKPKCKKHNEEAQLVCLTCSEYICCKTSNCLASHSSYPHERKTLYEFIQEAKEQAPYLCFKAK